jgi:VanZ family protein
LNSLKWRVPFIAWTLTLLFLTWYPKVEIPDIGINAEDKIAHIGVFCLWGLLLLRMLTKYEINTPTSAVRMVIIFGTLFGVIDESVQGFIPGRYFTMYDMLANVVGVWISPMVFKFMLLPLVRRIFLKQD